MRPRIGRRLTDVFQLKDWRVDKQRVRIARARLVDVGQPRDPVFLQERRCYDHACRSNRDIGRGLSCAIVCHLERKNQAGARREFLNEKLQRLGLFIKPIGMVAPLSHLLQIAAVWASHFQTRGCKP